MPDRLYGEHYPDSFLDVPRPVRATSVATLGDYIQQLRKISDKSDQRCFACEPNKPSEPHQCPNNAILTCNCADDKYCAELGSDPDRQHNGNEDRCPNHDGFSDNLDYIGNPYPNTKGQGAVSGWPCVVVGAICETWTSATERVLRTTAGEWDTKRDTYAG